MASTMTLDQIRDAADKKYGATVVDLGDGETVELRNPLRLSKEARDKITSIKEDEYDDVLDYFREVFEAVAGKVSTRKLVKALDGDVALYVTLFENYMSGVELGEASPSQD